MLFVVRIFEIKMMLKVLNIIKYIRKILTSWIPNFSKDFLRMIREYELQGIIKQFPKNCEILEIGGGSGWQANIMKNMGFNVYSVDIKGSEYFDEKIFNVQVYDGINLPFNDKKFDLIFSSNVLEHITLLDKLQSEIHRVLKDDGIAVHILPSSSWRLWTIFTDIIKFWRFTKPHGEHATNVFYEIFYFKINWWKKSFIKNKWEIFKIIPNKLFYTGNLILGKKLTIQKRKLLSLILGSSCNIYFLKKKS